MVILELDRNVPGAKGLASKVHKDRTTVGFRRDHSAAGLEQGMAGFIQSWGCQGADDQWREDSSGAEQTTGKSISGVITSGKYDSQKGGIAGEC